MLLSNATVLDESSPLVAEVTTVTDVSEGVEASAAEEGSEPAAEDDKSDVTEAVVDVGRDEVPLGPLLLTVSVTTVSLELEVVKEEEEEDSTGFTGREDE